MLLPDQISKNESEHSQQAAFFAWAAIAVQFGIASADEICNFGGQTPVFKPIAPLCSPEPLRVQQALKWLHAIPNGGSRGDNQMSRMIRGANLKAEGVKDGVADVFFPLPTYMFAGLYIEFKKPNYKTHKNGGLSDKQLKFFAYATTVAYCYEIAYCWRDGATAIKNYLKGLSTQ